MVLKLEIRVSVCSKHIVYFLNIEKKYLEIRFLISDGRKKKSFFLYEK